MADDQPADQPDAQPVKKRGRGAGRPFREGESGNPSGLPKPPEPPDDGVVTAEKMRKVLGQAKAADAGHTEQQLRKWLDKDPKGFTQEIDRKARAEAEDPGLRAELAAAGERADRLERELAAARKQLAGDPEDDPGTDAALAQIKKLLRGDGADDGPDGCCRSCGQVVPAAGAA